MKIRRLGRQWLVAALCLAAAPVQAIVHGKSVNQPRFLSDYPWMVTIETPLAIGVCSGVLISPTYVLTAGHCTALYKRILVGNTSRRRARVIEVADARLHPDFNRDTKQFDVGLIRLAEPVDLPPLPLISWSDHLLSVKENEPAEVLGWGKRPGTGFSERLVRAPIALRKLDFVGTLVLYTDRGGPCGGDSGGPLVVKGIDGQAVLAGVASVTAGNLCDSGGGRAAYTSIDSVRRFILRHVPDLPEASRTGGK